MESLPHRSLIDAHIGVFVVVAEVFYMPKHVAFTVLWHAIAQMRADPVIDHRRFFDGIALDRNTAQQNEAASFEQFFTGIVQDWAQCR